VKLFSTMKTVTLFQNLRNYEKATIVFTGLSLIFSGLTLLAVVVYAVLTYKQWQEMKRSTDAATGNFKMDERAWMGFSFAEGNLTLTLNKSFLVPTELVNTGKTPAQNVHGDIVVGVFRKGEPLDFTYGTGHAHYGVAAGTIFPGGKIVESFEAIRHGQRKAEPIIFTAPVKDEIFSGGSFIVVHG
jgi:hypothetical protein